MPEQALAELEGLLDQIAVIDKAIDAEQRDLAAASGHVAANADGWIDGLTGSPLMTLRAGDDVRARMRLFGRMSARSSLASNGQGATLSEFFRTIAGMGRSENPDIRAALSGGTDSAGGYSIPPVLVSGILEAMMPISSVLTAGAPIVVLDQGAKSYRVARVTSIPVPQWRNEAANIALADPSFDALDVVPRSLALIIRVSRELLADSANIDAALSTILAQAFAREIDRVALLGSGTAPEPRGLTNTSGVGSVTNGANGATLANYAGFLTAVSQLLAANMAMPTAAVMTPRDLVKLAGLIDTTNQPLVAPPLLKDLKLLQTSQLPTNLTVGTSTDCSRIYVGDFTQMGIFLREQLSIGLLRELYAGTGELGFLCHVRADIGVLRPAAFSIISGVRP